MTTAPHPYQISVKQYDAMVNARIFPSDAHIELLEGELIEVSTHGLPHAACIRRLTGLLHAAGAEPGTVLVHAAGAEPGTVLVQILVRTAWNSKPEPDLVLLRRPAEQYDRREWNESDVLLLVEVSFSSLKYDRRRKLPHYARAGIPEFWLVEVEHELIRTYRNPQSDGYKLVATRRRGDSIQAELFPQLNVTVDQILGPND